MEAKGRPRVLVVEDEALLSLELAVALGDAGLDAIEVSNAPAAMAALSGSPQIQVMITDVELFGEVDGIRLCWMVRQKWPPIHIFVISARHRIEELDLPVRCQFFAKPYRIDRLIGELGNRSRPLLDRRPMVKTSTTLMVLAVMVEPPREWESFWDLVTPAEAAELMRADHGAKALQAAEECAEVALADGRETDQRFWLAVAAELKGKCH